MTDRTGEQRPLLRVIHGNATDEEIAAVLAVVSASGGTVDEPEPEPTSTWSDPAPRMRGVRAVFSTGRDGWRTSYWPR